MANRIPRKFKKITGKMLIKTNMDEPGDIIHVFKNDYGYSVLNLRTGKYAYAFLSMLRTSEIFQIQEII